MIDADEALAFARELADWASHEIRTSAPGPVTVKENPADVVTEIDLLIERTIRSRIAARYPDHAVDGEEYGAPTDRAEYTWHLDPIDGTTNFANSLPWCSFSLALADDDGPLVGVVADPYRGTVFAARRGGGAFINDVAAHCSNAESLAGTVILTEWNGHEPWPGMTETMAAITRDFGTIRIMGSSALALAHAAVGHASAALIGSYHGVDDMAGVLIATEAGAVVRGRHGGADPGPDGVLVAAPGVAERVAELWG
jgi:fructose-1,6-bisphosphatase/inositol monophosphatase family enzyme